MFVQTRRSQAYDVVIIGSGAAGGINAKVLVEGGLRVALLEAGPLRDQWKDFAYHDPFPYEMENRGIGQKAKTAIFRDKYSFIQNPDEPYTTPKELPYDWFRARNVGGRTMFW